MPDPRQQAKDDFLASIEDFVRSCQKLIELKMGKDDFTEEETARMDALFERLDDVGDLVK